jgi:hypothetical protein
MTRVIAECPEDPAHSRFRLWAVVGQQWEVDGSGILLQRVGEDQVIVGATSGAQWRCCECGSVAVVVDDEPALKVYRPRLTGIDLRGALRIAEDLGCAIRGAKGGERLVSHPSWVRPINVSRTRRDCPRSLSVALGKLWDASARMAG